MSRHRTPSRRYFDLVASGMIRLAPKTMKDRGSFYTPQLPADRDPLQELLDLREEEGEE